MTILFLSPEHELVRGSSDAQSAEFASDPRHPGETPKVLAIFDDHSSPTTRTEIVPADPEIQEWIPKVATQIRTSTILDVLEAVSKVLERRDGASGLSGSPEEILDEVRAIVDQPKVPEGWTAWGQIPRGSLSSLGDGRWMLVWPALDERGRDMALFAPVGDDSPARVRWPEQAYRPDRAIVAFARVVRAGLTSAQIDDFIAADHPEIFDPEAVFAAMFPTSEAA